MSLSPVEQHLLDLCAVPSLTGEEGPLCDRVEAQLRALLGEGAVARDGHSLVVTPKLSASGPRVVLAGHFDVVKTQHDGPTRVEGDRIYGPGAADMKSGLAVMLCLLEDIARGAAPKFQPTFVFYEREEGPFLENRLGDILEHFPSLQSADLAVCLEPSSNGLQLGCMGSLHARVHFHGRTSHSARPWQGENAIHKSGAFLSRLAALAPRDVTIEGMLYREVISATLAEGGRGRNIVPDRFTLNVNHRFAPGRTADDAVADLQALVQGDAEIEVFDRSPSAPPYREHPLVQALIAEGVEGVEPKQAWTDVARFASVGVAAVNLGPGTQSQAHQRNEWTDRAALERGMILFRRWLFGSSP
ncbi:MAG: succinyl-diaminopimelate desuccinylase [Deltaproteobacteria bacterium]|nr:succinyl-diaminopimelate desuccinylase [Deltaproteobacteria bacterium]